MSLGLSLCLSLGCFPCENEIAVDNAESTYNSCAAPTQQCSRILEVVEVILVSMMFLAVDLKSATAVLAELVLALADQQCSRILEVLDVEILSI